MRTLRDGALRVSGERGVTDEERGQQRVRHRLASRVRVLLLRRERAGCCVGDRIEREPKREPGNHERDAAAE